MIRYFRKRAVRTLSGVAPVAVLTMPYSCPGTCAYCPNEKDVPRSYLSNEPAVMRAIRCDYNPYVQVQDRLRALEANGHAPEKIELIVIGGTWSVLPVAYKYWYVKECFRGANDFARQRNFQFSIFNFQTISKFSISKLQKELLVEQKKNEKARYKIIGLTLETRPDYINEKELWEMRELGCTRVELGVQAIDDEILKLNKRGHDMACIAEATALLRSFGFKITYHLMPGLPGATPAKDLAMFQMLFSDLRFQPDQIKFYPTVVTKGSLLYRWWKAGKYVPYTDEELQQLIIDCKKIVPEYVRIIRLIRDIPGESIEAGNKITNLRQVMQQRGVKCNCIRCRESRNSQLVTRNSQLEIINYNVTSGEEYFLQYTNNDGRLLGFCRMFLPHNTQHITRNKKGGKKLQVTSYKLQAIIRELHIYGELVPVGENKKIQHAGLGKKLLKAAEKIAKKNKCEKISVISGVGVRGYYRKLGFRLKDSYMTKKLQ